MKTKIIRSFILLLTILIVNTAVGCNDKPDKALPAGYKYLIGKWEIINIAYNTTKQDGSFFTSTTEIKSKGISIVWEFFADGRLVATQDGKSQEVHWSLKLGKSEVKDAEEGTITLTGGMNEQLAASFGQTGGLEYKIIMSSLSMSLQVDVTKIGPYKKNVMVQVFNKIKL